MTNENDAARVKQQLREAVANLEEQLVIISEELHSNPETAWREVRSAATLCSVLRDWGFTVEEDYLGLATAFRATLGSGSFRVGLMAEYDALPGLGHACGHNLIAAMSLGAAAALANIVDVCDLTVRVYGTPAEEGGGGKIEMLDRGAFHDLSLALMAHPAPVDVAEARPFAVAHWSVVFEGKSSHAAAYPTLGINAADAFTVAQVGIGLLRQQLPPTVRVHGIVTEAGTAPNAIPGRSSGRWYVRAASLTELDEVTPRVEACFEAGALATGCELTITPESKPYAEFRTDQAVLDHYVANALAIGRTFEDFGPAAAMATASTDMGNVSQVVSAIHPYIGIGSYPISNHQPEFAQYCVGPAARRAILDGATALAWTAYDTMREQAHVADP